jgi:hypothetical protein
MGGNPIGTSKTPGWNGFSFKPGQVTVILALPWPACTGTRTEPMK